MCVQKTWMCKRDGCTKETLYSLLMHTKCAQKRCVCTRDVCAKQMGAQYKRLALFPVDSNEMCVHKRLVCQIDVCAK